MRRFWRVAALCLGLPLLLFTGGAGAQTEMPGDWYPDYVTEDARGLVLSVSEYEEIENDWFFQGRQLLTVEIMTGRFQGDVEEVENTFTGNPYRDLKIKEGDQVILLLELDQGRLHNVHLNGIARDRYIYILAAVFVFAVILIARTKGIKAIVNLVLMGFVILRWLLPLILQGYNPLLLTMLFTSLLTVVTLLIVSGVNTKTVSAILGTIGGVMAAGLVAWIFGNAAQLTGFGKEAQMLYFADLGFNIDMRGLLFSGIIIGSLGAVMDVAMSIASAVAEVKRVSPLLTLKGLFQSGFNVGKDVLGTMVNTLILAYTGGSLPLLLLFMANNLNYMSIINMDLVATEIIRSLAGSLGLLISVPLTAITASFLMTKFEKKA